MGVVHRLRLVQSRFTASDLALVTDFLCKDFIKSLQRLITGQLRYNGNMRRSQHNGPTLRFTYSTTPWISLLPKDSVACAVFVSIVVMSYLEPVLT